MNSRSSVNETNLVNFSADLSTLNQLDAKDGLLSFPFDHIYACHSQSSDRRQPLQLEKEIEITTHCVAGEETDNPEVTRLTEQLTIAENQNKKLKDLLIFHLDLIQQQNELITKRDKLYHALKQENDTLKTKLIRMDRRIGLSPRHTLPTATITSSLIKTEPVAPEVILNSFSELLLPDKGNSFLSDRNRPFGQVTFGIARTHVEPVFGALYRPKALSIFSKLVLSKIPSISMKTPSVRSRLYVPSPNSSILMLQGYCRFSYRDSGTVDEVPSQDSADVTAPPPVDKKLNSDNFKMIDNKRSLVKKEVKTEPRSEALYTVTSNSGNPIIQRIHKNRRRTSSIGSLSRMTKTPKAEIPETITSKSKMMEQDSYDRTFSVNKKSKMINTYGKSRNSSTIPKRTTQFTGSLSDRLQLIDTTPTGEDPYQLGEADMREQSPIPKLMLQKTNHGRMKICTDPMGETTTRRIYDMPDTKTKINRFMSVYEQPKKVEKTLIVQEPDMDLVKTETEIGWSNIYNDKPNETSLCDFSYGEASMLPSLDANEFQELFTSDSALNLDNLNQLDEPPEKMVPDKTTKRRMARTTSLMVPDEDVVESKRGMDSRRGRKRAFSTTGLGKQQPQKGQAKPKAVRGRGGAAARGKKSPVPGQMTMTPYPTLVGDADMSWYFGLDPEMVLDDLDPFLSQASTVEVPRWREKVYTSSYTLEGTENLDDKVFEKRHQKLEAEERRQLRWHMRRVREQRHVEKLRQRQRDSWCSSPVTPPAVYTVWPRPQQEARFIEITPELPVNSFGEPLPQMPESDFMLPWVRTSKALKRSKRSKTLH